MATPTGYKFLDATDNTVKDFADVFDITYPSPGVVTKYKSNLPPYSGKDLGEIFTSGSGSGKTTNYKYSTSIDLGTIFALKNQWSALGSGLSSFVYAIAVDSSNNVYVGGAFFEAYGILSTKCIAKWNGLVWSSVGGGIISGTQVSEIVIDSSDNVYICGSFTEVGFAGNLALNVAKWNGTTWTAFGSGVSGLPNTIALDSSNNVYVGGLLPSFSSNVAKWNGTTWTVFGSALNAAVWVIKINYLGDVYVGGEFTIPKLVAKWSGTAWVALSTGIDGTAVYTIEFNPGSSACYVGGNFNSVAGGPGSNVAYFNGGVTWSNLNGGVNGAVFSIKTYPFNSYVYVGGNFSQAGTSSPISVTNVAKWNVITLSWYDVSGGVFYGGTSTPSVEAIAIDNINKVYVGGEFNKANFNNQIDASNIAKYTP